MTRVFDRIQIAVPDLGQACAEYRVLFDVPAWLGDSYTGHPVARWGLPNTVVELVEGVERAESGKGAVEQACIQSLVFNVPTGSPGDIPVANALGLDLKQCDGRETQRFRDTCSEAQVQSLSVDHVVLRSEDADTCVELFRDELGVRLALEQTVPAWGGRMLFFRGGKLTLEVIESAADDSRGNYFWGLAYQCKDLEELVARLREQGAEISDTKEGRKPGTQVATIKSHCLGIPTLLIQPVTS